MASIVLRQIAETAEVTPAMVLLILDDILEQMRGRSQEENVLTAILAWLRVVEGPDSTLPGCGIRTRPAAEDSDA